MNRTINVKVKGNHLTKDSNNAGTRGEANVTTLRITFGDDWTSYVKKVLFWDAHGMNPTKYTLIPEWKENSESNVYLFNIPPSALGIAGNMTFRIDGYKDNKRQRSVSAILEVEDALIEGDIEEVTQTDLDNLLAQKENIKTIIKEGVNETFGYRNEALSSASDALTFARNAATSASNAKTSEENASESARAAAEGEEAVSFKLLVLEAYADAAAQSKTDAETAQGKAEEAKRDAETARDDARGYAENFESLAEAVTRAESSASFVEAQTDLIYGYKEQAQTAKVAAEKTLNDAEKLSEDIEVAKSDIELAMQSVSSSSYWARLSSASAEEAKNKAEEAQGKADEARKAAQTAQSNATQSANNAATSASNAKTYADNAENAVSQSRYIGANGNWYVWDNNLKTFVDSGETAHAGSTVYVGSNPPSNAQVWIDPDDDSDIAMSIKEIYNTIKSMKPKAITITLISSAWVVDGDRYSQIVSIPEATAYSKVDLQPSAEQLTIFHEKDIAFVTENVGGTITVYCIGQKPTNDYTIQATITEVIK